jgi:excisionase family DNA binding protein
MNKYPIRATSKAGVQEMYGVSRSTIDRAIVSGKLKVTRYGRKVIIFIRDVEKWLGKSR